MLALLWVAALTVGPAFARQDAVLRHPAIQEVRLMMKGGVDYDVMVERVRRMEDVPALDPAAVEALRREDVPDRVLVELARRKQVVTPCAIPERPRDLRQVLEDPAIQEVLHAVDAGQPTDAIVARVTGLTRVPVLDARALDRLTSLGVPDRALLELVRKQEIRTGCDSERAELLAAADQAARMKNEAAQRKQAEAELARTEAARQAEAEAARKQADIATRRETELKLKEAEAAKRKAKEQAQQEAKLQAATQHAVPIKPPDPAPVEEPSPPAHRTEALPELTGTGSIAIILKSALPFAYLEVFVDGNSVVRKGGIEEGETKPGWMLPPPSLVNLRRGEVLYESPSAAGPHEVKAAFALSRIVQTEWDAVVEAYGQRYETTKVGPLDAKGMLPVCEVREGRTCVVIARLVKHGAFYAVEYETTTHK